MMTGPAGRMTPGAGWAAWPLRAAGAASRARRHLALVAALALALLWPAAGVGAAPAAGPAPQGQTLPPGTVIALRGTPHIWLAGPEGQLHWASDTRAFEGQIVHWEIRREVSLDELRRFSRGDPLLVTGLVKVGDPIYLAKWETDQARPTLLHIRSIADVELFGITADNYALYVLDRADWERATGPNVDTLPKAELAPATAGATGTTPAVSAPPPGPTREAPQIVVSNTARRRLSDQQYETVVEITGGTPNTVMRVAAEVEAWVCNPNCTETRFEQRAAAPAGTTDVNGRLQWTDRHGPYRRYTYTFTDQSGATVSVNFDDDRQLR